MFSVKEIVPVPCVLAFELIVVAAIETDLVPAGTFTVYFVSAASKLVTLVLFTFNVFNQLLGFPVCGSDVVSGIPL